jgi:predicted nucleic acid-binding protein
MASKTQAVTDQKRLVLDANILLRAVFGSRVRSIFETYEGSISFYTPDICFSDAREYIPTIAAKRRISSTPGMEVLEHLSRLIEIVDRSLYEAHEHSARKRMLSRDVDDWPIFATSLLLRCPVWTEDRDFFGSGISTWTTETIELYLRET